MNWNDYKVDWDHINCYFTSKQAAKNLATALVAELKLNPKAVQVEGKRGAFHVFIPIASKYWTPWSVDWDTYYMFIQDAIKQEMTDE